MSHPPKLDVALATLASTGIWRSSYAPPLHRLLWRLGVFLPPPHFASFGLNFVLSAVWFGVLWEVVMWLLIWSRDDVSIVMAAGVAAVGGSLFGLSMATYYRYGAHKYNLPQWSQIEPEP